MKRKRLHLIQDLILIALSIGVAVLLVRSGAIHTFAEGLGEFEWAGTVIAGMLFTSVFTTAPAIAILGELAQEHGVLSVALLGAIGAVVGDIVIFNVVRDRFAEDLKFLLQHRKRSRFTHIFRTRFFHSLLPFFGALIIASPLPDELGLALLGLSGVRDRSFIFISYAMNALGILAIGLVATNISWLW